MIPRLALSVRQPWAYCLAVAKWMLPQGAPKPVQQELPIGQGRLL